jgi:hypothetical protein
MSLWLRKLESDKLICERRVDCMEDIGAVALGLMMEVWETCWMLPW